MAGKNDLYDQLGIQTDATKNDIRMAYHRKALKYHPDKNSDTDASEKFKSISQAYETLLDSVTNNPPIEVFKVAVQGLSPEEIDVNITIDELLDRWSDLRVAKLPIKERLGLREDQHYTDLIDAFLDQGRLLHIHTVGKDKRQPIAYKALLETSVEAKIPQAYRDLLEKWNGDDAIDGLIRNGKYLGENGEEVERPSKPSATQTTPIMQICKKYEEVFTRFCASSNPEAIKVLTEDFNTMLKAQWSATPETERLEPPNWNIVSERLEVAKAVNEKRKNTSQHDPEYGSFYSAVEIEKARFTKEARDYGFGDAYCEIYNKAIEDCTNTDPSLVGSIDKITAQADPTKDVEMGEAPDAGAIGEIEPRIKAYNKETEGWHNIIAWRPWGKGNQVVLEMTAEGAKTPVCHLHPSGPNKGAFETFKESKGLNMSDHKGTQQDLKGHKFDAFKWVSIIYKHRTTTEPQLGWAKEAAMFAQGSIGGQEPFKFYSKYEMGKEWGRDFMLGEFATRINSAQLPAPKPPSRNLLAATGRKALENQPYHAGLPTMERQQTQSLLTNIATQAAKVQPQLGALGDTTQQLRFPMQNNQLPMQNNQLPMQNNQLPVAQTQVQLDELVKPMEKMSLEALWRELQFYRSQAELANVVQPTIMQPALMQA